MDKELEKYLAKHIKGELDSAGMDELARLVAASTDTDLEKKLARLWDSYDMPEAGAPSFDDIISRLGIPRKQPQRVRLWKYTSVAAAIFIPILIITQVLSMQKSARILDLVSREVAVTVESGEKAMVVLPDGTQVWLNAATEITYRPDFGLNDRTVTLSGEAFFDVAHDGSPFTVEAHGVSVEVLGTKFNVMSYPNENTTETTLVEGEVRLVPHDSFAGNVVMQPNQKVTFDRRNGAFFTKGTSTYQETAWMRGELVFRSASFGQMMEKLSRRYGCQIIVTGDLKEDDNFTGSFREDSVYGVLRILQIHYPFTLREAAGIIYVDF